MLKCEACSTAQGQIRELSKFCRCAFGIGVCKVWLMFNGYLGGLLVILHMGARI